MYDYSLELEHINGEAVLSFNSLVRSGQHNVLLRYKGVPVGEIEHDADQAHIKLTQDIGKLFVTGDCQHKTITVQSASDIDWQSLCQNKQSIDITAKQITINESISTDKFNIKSANFYNNQRIQTKQIEVDTEHFIDNGQLLIQSGGKIKSNIYTVQENAIELYVTEDSQPKLNIETNFAHIHGKCEYQRSDFTVHNRLTLNGVLILGESQANIKLLTQNGDLLLTNKSNVNTHIISTNHHLFLLDQSQLQTDHHTVGPQGQLYCEAESNIHINNLLLNHGTTLVKKTNLTAKQIINHGNFGAEHATLTVPFNFTNENALVIIDSTATIPYFTLHGQYELSNVDLKNHLTSEAGTGKWSYIKLKTNVLDSESQQLSIDHSQIEADGTLTNGKTNLSFSELKTDTLCKEQGQLALANVRLLIKNALVAANRKDNTLTIAQTAMLGPTAIVWLENQNYFSNCYAQLNAFASGQLQAEDCLFKINTSFVSNRPTELLKQTQVDANDNLVFAADTKVGNGVTTKAGNEALVSAATNVAGTLIAQGQVGTIAPLTLSGGRLIGNTLKAFDTCHLKNGASSYLQNDAIFFNDLILDNARVVSGGDIIGKQSLNGQKGFLAALNNISLEKTAHANLAKLNFQAGDAIYIARGTPVTGQRGLMKTHFFYNKGDLNYKKLFYADTDYTINSGSIYSDGITKVDANRLLFNALGSIRGGTTIINAIISLNLGDIVGYDALIHNSLVNLNIGFMRSFNAEINNILNINLGFCLPTLPASKAAVFSQQHVLSASKLILMNLFPHLANGINFIFSTIPLAKLLYKKVSEIQESNLPFLDYLADEFASLKDMRLIDIMQYILAVKTAVEAGMHLEHCLENIPAELASFSWQNLLADLSHPSISVLTAPAMVFGPTLNQSSIASINAGVSFSQNKFASDIASVNTGIDVGLQSNIHHSLYAFNNGMVTGAMVDLKGRALRNTGDVLSNRLNCHYKSADLTEGNIRTHHFNAEIDHLTDPLDFIEGKGKYKNIQVDRSFSYKTLDNIDVNRTLAGSDDIAIYAPSLAITAEQNNHNNLYFEATDDDLLASNHLSANQSLRLKAKGNIITDYYDYLAKNTVSLDAGKSIYNGGGFIYGGKNCYLHAANGDIYNVAGLIYGGNYLQGSAAGNIVNTCIEEDVRGRYDTMKKYTQGVLVGGAGIGHNHRGIVLHAGDKINVDASSAYALGDIIYIGDQGYDTKPRSHQYVSYDHTKRSGLFSNKKSRRQVISTQLERPQNVSSNGKVIIVSKNGSVIPIATDFITAQGTYVAAQGPVAFYDYLITEKSTHDQSNLFGLTRKHEEFADEIAVPSLINNPNQVQLVSLTDDVILHGVVIDGPGLLIADAGGDIIGSVSVENHRRYMSQKGFNLALMGETLLSSHSQSTHINLPFSQRDPLSNAAKQLSLASNNSEATISAANALNAIASFKKRVMPSLIRGDMTSAALDYFGIGAIQPSLHLGLTIEKEELNWQTPGAGGIHVGSAKLKAKGNIIFVGMPVVIDGQTQIDCQHLIQEGLILQNSYQHQQSEWGLDLGASKYLFDINYAKNQNARQELQYHHQLFHTGPLNLHCQDWVIHNADAEIESLAGNVPFILLDNDLVLTKDSESSTALSTNGDLHLTRHEQCTGKNNYPGTLTIHQPIDPTKCQLGAIINHGGEVNAELPVNTVQINETLNGFDNEHGYEFNGNIHDLLPEPPQTPNQVDAEQVNLFAELCDAVYADETTVDDYHVIDSYFDRDTSARVVAFYNAQNNSLIFVIEGTTGLKRLVTDDVDLLAGKEPRSYRKGMKQFINQMLLTTNANNVYFTGHSAGAAGAALASSDFKYPAIVFENPGIANATSLYDFSQVTSVQAAPNVINQLGKLTGRRYDQGHTIQVDRSATEKLRDTLLDSMHLPGMLYRNYEDHDMAKLHRNFSQQACGFFYHNKIANQSNNNKRSTQTCSKVF